MGPRSTRRGGSRAWWTAVVAVVMAAGLAACGSSAASSTTTGGGSGASGAIPSFYTPPDPLPHAAPGTLIRSVKVTGVPGVPSGATVWRIMYHSTTIYGADEAESGYVITPSTRPPVGGFPIIAWAHGTSGFAASCAPSLFTDSGGGSGPYLIPGLDQYLRAGYAIAAADYQGLGVADGVHPYLLGSSEGRSVLDATRAARQLSGLHTSGIVVIYGHSQGGQSALFAAQMAPTYAPELHVVGVVAAAPATGLSTLISVIGTPAGAQYMPYSIPAAYAWTQTYDDLPVSDVFTPSGARFATTEVTRGCADQVAAAIATQHLRPQQVFQAAASTDPTVVALARANDPGNVRTDVPMLVVQGTADQTVPPTLTDAFVTTRACPIGDRVEYLHVTGATHGTVVFEAAPSIVAWMDARRAGKAASTTCGQPGDVATLTP
ncbi:MAG: lipase family protein [Acidimicrobiales bacterium]|jgi:pimeloyl-ACP methyl ester carboxylesterase